MLLTPHDILKHLGFDIPEEGVRINPNDAFMITTALRLMGTTMNAESIPLAELEQMHTGMAGIVAAWRNEEPAQINEDSLLKLRATIKVLLTASFKYRDC